METSNKLELRTSAIRTGLRPHSRQPDSRPVELSFIHPQNLLPPSHPRHIPVTAQQLRDLRLWSGINIDATANLMSVNRQAYRMWTNINRGVQRNKIIPPTIWHYYAIRLGLVNQPNIRRVEPDTVITKTYPSMAQTLTFRAVISYKSGLINLYDDSTLTTSTEPFSEIPVDFVADRDNEILSISGMRRSDNCPWEFENTDGNEVTDKINDFVKSHIWPACWRLHDFNALDPDMFLKQENLLPITEKGFRVPNPKTLLRFAKWLGATGSDIASLVWEDPKHMRYLLSPKANEELLETLKETKPDKADSEAKAKEKEKIRFNRLMRSQITPQGWAILLAASGLTPKLQVQGQADPRVRHEKLIKIEEVQGVPIKYIKIKVLIDWADVAKTILAVTFSFSTQNKMGTERTVTFPVTIVAGNAELDGKMLEEGATENWIDSITPDEDLNISDEHKQHIRTWAKETLWRNAWNVIYFDKID